MERDILSIVWRLGNVTAEQVREELDRPLKDSTVRTVLRRLEEKGYLAHTMENRTFFYQPAESRQKVAGRAVQRIVDWFCEGSVEELLVGMVDSKVLDRAELQRLADRIAAGTKESRSREKGGQAMMALFLASAIFGFDISFDSRPLVPGGICILAMRQRGPCWWRAIVWRRPAAPGARDMCRRRRRHGDWCLPGRL